ncbi:universal stress protein [uncultured Arthrobacter sp.]|uniref:universal stress protein n=1 Tax=uncultured Arthrobacter sp. TaxID=114050 RepID=UPI0032177CA4
MRTPDWQADEGDGRSGGPVVLGVAWSAPEGLVRAAAELAAALELHLICAYVDPASYLTEWEPPGTLLAASLDPVVNDEALQPAGELRYRVEGILGPGGPDWSFRVLNGAVSRALARLADSTGASMLVIGGGRDGLFPRLTRMLEGSVATTLTRIQRRPVLVIPAHSLNANRRRTSA